MHRAAAWSWVYARYVENHPNWQILEAWVPGGPWCKASAVASVLEQAEGDVLVIADADVWCEDIDRGVMAIVCGYDWAMPHDKVYRLSQEGTAAALAGDTPKGQELSQNPYPGVWGGGIVVLNRESYFECPLDPRFTNWGQEDESWAVALTCLYGEGWRGNADLTHLWHPPQQRATRAWGSPEGKNLKRRYRKARHDPGAMRALLQEIGMP